MDWVYYSTEIVEWSAALGDIERKCREYTGTGASKYLRLSDKQQMTLAHFGKSFFAMREKSICTENSAEKEALMNMLKREEDNFNWISSHSVMVKFSKQAKTAINYLNQNNKETGRLSAKYVTVRQNNCVFWRKLFPFCFKVFLSGTHLSDIIF